MLYIRSVVYGSTVFALSFGPNATSLCTPELFEGSSGVCRGLFPTDVLLAQNAGACLVMMGFSSIPNQEPILWDYTIYCGLKQPTGNSCPCAEPPNTEIRRSTVNREGSFQMGLDLNQCGAAYPNGPSTQT